MSIVTEMLTILEENENLAEVEDKISLLKRLFIGDCLGTSLELLDKKVVRIWKRTGKLIVWR